jgi:hypothetical protein
MSNKLPESDLQEILTLRQRINDIATVLGEIQYQKLSLDLIIDEQKAAIQEIKKQEANFFERIRSTYGNVSVNLDTGDIT